MSYAATTNAPIKTLLDDAAVEKAFNGLVTANGIADDAAFLAFLNGRTQVQLNAILIQYLTARGKIVPNP